MHKGGCITSNILVAIKNLATQPIISIKSHYSGRNRVNGVGDALEKYVKEFYCIMKKEKFDSFPQKDKQSLFNLADNTNLFINDLKIRNPNNPADLLSIKFLEFYYE